MNDETFNDLRYYIEHRCSEFGHGAIVVSMVKSEGHFYVLLLDLRNQAATILDPGHMTSFQPDRPYYSKMLGEICRVLKNRPVVYDVLTNGPEGKMSDHTRDGTQHTRLWVMGIVRYHGVLHDVAYNSSNLC